MKTLNKQYLKKILACIMVKLSKKRIVSGIVIVCLLLTIIPITAFMASAVISTEQYITFSSNGEFSLRTSNNSKNWDGVLEYSTDLSSWSVWGGTTALSSSNGKLYLRGEDNTKITGSSNRNGWKLTPVTEGIGISCTGNIMTLLDHSPLSFNITADYYAFAYMFYNCTALISAPELPATKLSNNCYQNMFEGCISLTDAPALPAEKLAESCYENMFKDCTALTVAPELPAEELAKNCYENMFEGCISLNVAPALPAITLAESCYENMFKDCVTLITPPELPATILESSCYYGMFKNCTKLTAAPSLSATELAYGCYKYMFDGCISLTVAPALSAITLAESCYENMFKDCVSLSVAPTLPASDLSPRCYYGMFYGCEVLNSPPIMNATGLAESCYSNMFYGCKSLTKAPALPATILAEQCYRSMFQGCTSLIKAPTLSATTMTTYCYESMFKNCSNLTVVPELPATDLAEYCYQYMFQDTGIKLSDTKNGKYTKEWYLPTEATTSAMALESNGKTWNKNMFYLTDGTFTGPPKVGTVYYQYVNIDMDINGDLKIDEADLIAIKQDLLGLKSYSIDVNDDGVEDVKDLVRFSKYLDAINE